MAKDTTISNVTNKVSVTVNRTLGNNSYVGGLTGDASATTSFTNVKNEGNISGYAYVGGITGRFSATKTIDQAYNTGDVTAQSTYCGGITAQASAANSIVSNCINVGKVIGSGYTGGVIGYVNTSVTVKDCINTGNVTANGGNYSGGFAGGVANANAVCSNNISTGIITASDTAKYVGDFLGNAAQGTICDNASLASVDAVIANKGTNKKITNTESYQSVEAVLYAAALKKDLTSFDTETQAILVKALTLYAEKMQDKSQSYEEKAGIIKAIAKDRSIVESYLKAINVDVYVTAQAENTFLAAPQTITVNAYLAESYGYQDSVTSGVSALDVLVAENKLVYGSDFTPETASNYLTLTDNANGASVKSAFGMDAVSKGFGFAVDGAYPHDGVAITGSTGTYYTGYTIDQAGVADGQAAVTNYDVLVLAETALVDLEKAAAVDQEIAGIGAITENSEEKAELIGAARDAYNCLTEVQQKLVTKYDTLTAAESKLADLLKASDVDKLINEIGTVSVDSKDAIGAARTAYDLLSDEQKAYVEELDTLTAAEKAYVNAAKGQVEDLIDAIGSKVTLDSKDAIAAARAAYDTLSQDAKAKTALTYTSSNQSVVVVNAKGVVTVKGIGTAVITVKASGANYKDAAKKITIIVNPKTQKITSLSKTGKKAFTVKLTKNTKATGYQVVYSTSSKFTKATTKTATLKGSKATSKKITGLKSGKKYYVKVRTYKKVGTKTYYSAYSSVKTVMVK